MAASVPTDEIMTGVVLFVVLPSPIWPSPFSPHAHRFPSASSASVWWAPAAILVMVV